MRMLRAIRDNCKNANFCQEMTPSLNPSAHAVTCRAALATLFDLFHIEQLFDNLLDRLRCKTERGYRIATAEFSSRQPLRPIPEGQLLLRKEILELIAFEDHLRGSGLPPKDVENVGQPGGHVLGFTLPRPLGFAERQIVFGLGLFNEFLVRHQRGKCVPAPEQHQICQ